MKRMARIQWSERAERDLLELKQFIERRASQKTAVAFIKRLRKAVQNLRRFPESGAHVEIIEHLPLREIYVKTYRIIYQLTGGVVQIVTIRRGARSLDEKFPD
jgi:addiction module RelE/StbE family toxin